MAYFIDILVLFCTVASSPPDNHGKGLDSKLYATFQDPARAYMHLSQSIVFYTVMEIPHHIWISLIICSGHHTITGERFGSQGHLTKKSKF